MNCSKLDGWLEWYFLANGSPQKWGNIHKCPRVIEHIILVLQPNSSRSRRRRHMACLTLVRENNSTPYYYYSTYSHPLHKKHGKVRHIYWKRQAMLLSEAPLMHKKISAHFTKSLPLAPPIDLQCRHSCTHGAQNHLYISWNKASRQDLIWNPHIPRIASQETAIIWFMFETSRIFLWRTNSGF